MATSNSERAHTWRRLAKQTVSKVNVGWVLQIFAPVCVILSLLIATAIILMRSFEQPLGRFSFYLPVGLVAVAALGGAWFFAKRRFIHYRDGLVRLEDRLHLNNQLTTAHEGHIPWPDVPKINGEAPPLDSGFRWRVGVVSAPFLISAIMVAAAVFVPVTNLLEAKPEVSEPLARKQMDDWLERLKEDGVVQEEALKKYEEKIEELRGQPQEDWFSHSALEATDSLRQSLAQDIRDLGQELSTAERNMNALQKFGTQMGAESRERLLEEYDQAIQDLAMSGLPLTKEMQEMLEGVDLAKIAQGGDLDALKKLAGATGMDPQQLKEALKELNKAMNNPEAGMKEQLAMQAAMKALQQQNPELFEAMKKQMLTEEQMEQLRQNMKKGAQSAQEMLGGGKLPEMGELNEEQLAQLLQQMGGKGGIQRGPGPAPLFLGDESNLNSNNLEVVQNPDYAKALPGQLVGIGEAKHNDEQKASTIREAGATTNLGQGGATVWKESLLPSEKAVLKRYFK